MTDRYRTASSEIGRWTDAPARIDDQGELVRPNGGPSAMAAAPSAVETGTIQTGTIPWTDAEYRYQGTYTGGLKDGKPHGKGDFAQEGGRKHLIGEWDHGVKQGPFVRRYLNGFKWVGNYVDDLREGEWRYVYAGANPLTNVYFYSRGRRCAGRVAAHMDGLKVGRGMMPIM